MVKKLFLSLIALFICVACAQSAQQTTDIYATNLTKKEHFYTFAGRDYFKALDASGNYGMVTYDDSIVIPLKYEYIRLDNRDSIYTVICRLHYKEISNHPSGDEVYSLGGDLLIDESKGFTHANMTNEYPGIEFNRYTEGNESLYGLSDWAGNVLIDSVPDIITIPVGNTYHMVFGKLPPDPSEDKLYEGLSFITGKKSDNDKLYYTDGQLISDYTWMGGGTNYRGKAIVLDDMQLVDAKGNRIGDTSYRIKFAFIKDKDGDRDLIIDASDGNYKPLLALLENESFAFSVGNHDFIRKNSGQKHNNIDIPESIIINEKETPNTLRLASVRFDKDSVDKDYRLTLTIGSDVYRLKPIRSSYFDSLLNPVLSENSNLTWVWLSDFLRLHDEWIK